MFSKFKRENETEEHWRAKKIAEYRELLENTPEGHTRTKQGILENIATLEGYNENYSTLIRKIEEINKKMDELLKTSR